MFAAKVEMCPADEPRAGPIELAHGALSLRESALAACFAVGNRHKTISLARAKGEDVGSIPHVEERVHRGRAMTTNYPLFRSQR